MEVVVVLAAIAVALLLAELLLPTGGALAFIGAAGLIAAGVVALGDNSENADAIGAGLIAAGVASIAGFAIVSRKVLEAHREKPQVGPEELIGREAEVRIALGPEGQVFVDGALWRARASGGGQVPAGTRVRVDSVDGLTLLVSPGI
ncbi:MAG: NfeD family protein [Solirubrobacterales bacterium]